MTAEGYEMLLSGSTVAAMGVFLAVLPLNRVPAPFRSKKKWAPVLIVLGAFFILQTVGVAPGGATGNPDFEAFVANYVKEGKAHNDLVNRTLADFPKFQKSGDVAAARQVLLAAMGAETEGAGKFIEILSRVTPPARFQRVYSLWTESWRARRDDSARVVGALKAKDGDLVEKEWTQYQANAEHYASMIEKETAALQPPK